MQHAQLLKFVQICCGASLHAQGFSTFLKAALHHGHEDLRVILQHRNVLAAIRPVGVRFQKRGAPGADPRLGQSGQDHAAGEDQGACHAYLNVHHSLLSLFVFLKPAWSDSAHLTLCN